jgi:putative endonuclease
VLTSCGGPATKPFKGNKMYYVYVLQSLDESKSFYIGYTSNLRIRLEQHNGGMNTSTKNKQWQIVYYEAYVSSTYARKREHKLKQHGKVKQLLLQRIQESLE